MTKTEKAIIKAAVSWWEEQNWFDPHTKREHDLEKAVAEYRRKKAKG